MFYFSYNIVQTAYYNLTLAIKYSYGNPVYNLIPALAIIWMGGWSRGQKYEGKVDFDGITHIWKDNCYGNGQLPSRLTAAIYRKSRGQTKKGIIKNPARVKRDV